MLAKCNIIEAVVEKLASLKYGVSSFEGKTILENYLEYLKCPSVDVVICNPSDCVNELTIFNCFFAIQHPIEVVSVTATQLVLSVDDAYIGAGFTYLWEYNTSLFTVLSTTQSSITLTGTAEVLNNVITAISVTITDINGCSDTKTCYYNKEDGINCLLYTPCPNNNFLLVEMDTTLCPSCSALVVT